MTYALQAQEMELAIQGKWPIDSGLFCTNLALVSGNFQALKKVNKVKEMVLKELKKGNKGPRKAQKYPKIVIKSYEVAEKCLKNEPNQCKIIL